MRTPFEKAYKLSPVSQVRVRTFESTYVLQDPDQPNKVTSTGAPLLLGHWARCSCPAAWLEIGGRSQGMLLMWGEFIGRMCSSNKGDKNVTEGTGIFWEVRTRRTIHVPRWGSLKYVQTQELPPKQKVLWGRDLLIRRASQAQQRLRRHLHKPWHKPGAGWDIFLSESDLRSDPQHQIHQHRSQCK